MCQQTLKRVARRFERHGGIIIVHTNLVVADGMTGVAAHFSEVEIQGDKFDVAAGT